MGGPKTGKYTLCHSYIFRNCFHFCPSTTLSRRKRVPKVTWNMTSNSGFVQSAIFLPYWSILSKIIAARVAKPGPGAKRMRKPGPGEEARAMMRRSQCSSFQQFDNWAWRWWSLQSSISFSLSVIDVIHGTIYIAYIWYIRSLPGQIKWHVLQLHVFIVTVPSLWRGWMIFIYLDITDSYLHLYFPHDRSSC